MMNKADFIHILPLHVRWGDADALGHVNNVQYIRYLESGRVSYCDDVLNMHFSPAMKVGWILADLQCSYVQQVHYPAELEICTAVTKIGGKSVTITSNIYHQGDDKPVLTSKGIMVWFDYEKQETELIPTSVRDVIKAYEKSVEDAAK
jgi:acyl-CoA thioester hydrolase